MYTLKQVTDSTLEYFEGDQLATKAWISKYCLRNKNGEYLELNPDDMHKRLAKEISRIEANYPNPLSYEQVYELLKGFKYIIPQGSPMYGIGNNNFITSLSNCFVIGSNDNADSYGSIMRTDEEQVQLMKRRGGVGHDMSHLRPSGALANNSSLGSNAGMTLYMERFSNSTREVSQDGRRGALMLSLDIRHPGAELFVDKKRDTTKVTGANVSLKITDSFMRAVKADDDFIETFPVNMNSSHFNSEFPCGIEELPYDTLVKGVSYNVYCRKIKARKLWDKIIDNAWSVAEPGILFWDKVKSESIPSVYGKRWEEVSTNPCAELPLPPYDSCRLLVLNLFSYVENPFTPKAKFDFGLFNQHVIYSQRFMDDIVDLEIEKIDLILNKIESDIEKTEIKLVEYGVWDQIKQKAVEGRRTGLGITGEGDMLAALGLIYGTKQASDFSVRVHKVMALKAYESSITMAKERGAFPIFRKELEEIHSRFVNRIMSNIEYDSLHEYLKYGRRNIALLTVAPTGTTSIMAQTTSGIEPLFAPYYTRRRKTETGNKVDYIDESGDKWEEYKVFHKNFVFWFQQCLINKDEDFHVWYDGLSYSLQDIEDWLSDLNENLFQLIFEFSPYFKATSKDVDYFEKVRMQGRIQEWIDHSISVTINMPEDVDRETVSKCYQLAWESGCKGMTVYREGSRSGVLITKKKEEQPKNEIIYHDSVKRPEVVKCDIYRKTVYKKDWMIVVGLLNNKPIEIFAFEDVDNSVFHDSIEEGTVRKVKSRVYELSGVHNGKVYVMPDIVSLIAIDDKSDTRKYSLMLRHGIHPKYIIDQIEEYATIVSFDKAIQRVLKNYIDLNGDHKQVCSECGSTEIVESEGCKKCMNCGNSKCG
jgi:ribonucleoside-diphosphate reductase alpha chain